MKALYLRHIMDLSAQDETDDGSTEKNPSTDDPSPRAPLVESVPQEVATDSSLLHNNNSNSNPDDKSHTSNAGDDMSNSSMNPHRRRQRRRSLYWWGGAMVTILFFFLRWQGWWDPEHSSVNATTAAALWWEQQVAKLPFEPIRHGAASITTTNTPLRYLTTTSPERPPRPGQKLAREGARAKYPVVIIHGFVTSGLEVWGSSSPTGQTTKGTAADTASSANNCAPAFRQRFWAAMYGARSFFQDRDCWRKHMQLNPWTGGDPDNGYRLRAATGVSAIDYFLANYWVFAKMVQSLADVGYSPEQLVVESYDWRLSFGALQQRDGYLTHLKHRIEAVVETRGEKVVLVSHSMGVLLVHYFMAWVTTDKERGGGGGGADWVDRHVHAYANIAGSHLGVPKAATALLSGDLSDLVAFNPVANLVENFFGRLVRREMWSTWGSIWMMLPKAPEWLWGVGSDMCRPSNHTHEIDDDTDGEDDDDDDGEDIFCPQRNNDTTDEYPFTPLLVMSDDYNETVRRAVDAHDDAKDSNSSISNDTALLTIQDDFVRKQTHTARETIDFLKAYGAGYGDRLANAAQYSYHDQDVSDENDDDDEPTSRTWHDPTRTPLPYAPNLKIYCLYGVGIETERAYYYKRNVVDHPESGKQNQNASSSLLLEEPAVVLDSNVQDVRHNVHTGIRYVDGDGSVPLLSLGYICADAWRRPSSGLNPSGTAVYTREYTHQPEFVVDDPVRGGPHAADHVDILGNDEMLTDVLRIVTGFEVEEKVQANHIVSEIEEIAAEINKRGGLFASHKEESKRKKSTTRGGMFGFLGRSLKQYGKTGNY